MWFRVESLWFRVWGYRDDRGEDAGGELHQEGPDLVWGLGFGGWGLGFGVWGLGFGIWGLGFGVRGSGFGVWGLGF